MMISLLQKLKYRLLPSFVRLLFRIIYFTARVKIVDERGEKRLPGAPEPRGLIYAFWHQHLLMGAFFTRRQGLTAIVSQSRDGEYFTRLISPWGYDFIRGSSSRGGPEAYRAAVALLQKAGGLWIAPDGPRGPYHVVKWGVIRMALETGSGILPMACGYSRKIVLNSWDKFRIPLPFANIVVVSGKLFEVRGLPDEENIKQLAKALEQRLEEVSAKASALAGERASAQ